MLIQCDRVVSCGEDDVGGSDARLLIKFVENALIQAVICPRNRGQQRSTGAMKRAQRRHYNTDVAHRY